MKRFVKSRAVRVTAVLMCALFAAITFSGAIFVTTMYNFEFYSSSKSVVKDNLLKECMYDYAYMICRYAVELESDDIQARVDSYTQKIDVYYELIAEDGSVYANLAPNGEKISVVLEYPNLTVYTESYIDYDDFKFSREESHEFSVMIFVPNDREYHDLAWYEMKYFDVVYDMRNNFIVCCTIAALLALVMYVFAVANAGKRNDSEKTELNFFDKIPLDLLAAADVVVALLLLLVCDSMWNDTLLLVSEIVSVFVFAIVVVLTSMTIVVRIKCGTFWQNNICVKFVRFIWRVGVKTFNALPIVWKAALGVCVIAVADALTAAIAYSGFVLPYIFLWVLIAVCVCYAAYNMLRLQKGARCLASGDLDAKIETSGLMGDFKSHAEDLNRIGEGMSAAVEEKMKGERFKTELITNVSHDIKTPVTSIINYVDLLGKCELENENANTYLDVLRRQSEKLKKLVEDIVEASKASSGVINVDFKQCDLSILLSQAAGEYEERFNSAGLNLVCRVPETPVPVLADGRLVFRIFDNLLGNALKYSLSGTRVYLTLNESDGYAFASVTNVSREELPADGNELSERFVRGDASRHTEGSGLGLSIAKSLAEVQNAGLIIKTDGDFFKATFRIRTVEIDKIC